MGDLGMYLLLFFLFCRTFAVLLEKSVILFGETYGIIIV